MNLATYAAFCAACYFDPDHLDHYLDPLFGLEPSEQDALILAMDFGWKHLTHYI